MSLKGLKVNGFDVTHTPGLLQSYPLLMAVVVGKSLQQDSFVIAKVALNSTFNVVTNLKLVGLFSGLQVVVVVALDSLKGFFKLVDFILGQLIDFNPDNTVAPVLVDSVGNELVEGG